MLAEEADYDINNKKDIEELFEWYGTHYIASAILGGRADFTSNSIITETTTTEDIGLAVEAKYYAVSGSASMDNAKKETLRDAETKTTLFVTGGNSEYANDIQDNDQYNKWAEGIKDDPVLCEFGDNGLRPIWELAESPTRQNDLKDYFEHVLLKRKEHELPPEIEIPIDVLGKVVYKKQSSGEKGAWAKWKNVRYAEIDSKPFIFVN